MHDRMIRFIVSILIGIYNLFLWNHSHVHSYPPQESTSPFFVNGNPIHHNHHHNNPNHLDASTNTMCPAGYYCPHSSYSPSNSISIILPCGNSNVFCPQGSDKPTQVYPGHYSIGGNSTATRTKEVLCKPGHYW